MQTTNEYNGGSGQEQSADLSTTTKKVEDKSASSSSKQDSSLFEYIKSVNKVGIDFENAHKLVGNNLLTKLEDAANMFDNNVPVTLEQKKETMAAIETALGSFILQHMREGNCNYLDWLVTIFQAGRKTVFGNGGTDRAESLIGRMTGNYEVMRDRSYTIGWNGGTQTPILNNTAVDPLQNLVVVDESVMPNTESEWVVSSMYQEGMDAMLKGNDLGQYVSYFARNSTDHYTSWMTLLCANLDMRTDLSDIYTKMALYTIANFDNEYVMANENLADNAVRTNVIADTFDVDGVPYTSADVNGGNQASNISIAKVSLGWILSKETEVNGQVPIVDGPIDMWLKNPESVVLIPVKGDQNISWSYIYSHLHYPWRGRMHTNTTTIASGVQYTGTLVVTNVIQHNANMVTIGEYNNDILFVDVLDKDKRCNNQSITIDDEVVDCDIDNFNIVQTNHVTRGDIINGWANLTQNYRHSPSLVKGWKRAVYLSTRHVAGTGIINSPNAQDCRFIGPGITPVVNNVENILNKGTQVLGDGFMIRPQIGQTVNGCKGMTWSGPTENYQTIKMPVSTPWIRMASAAGAILSVYAYDNSTRFMLNGVRTATDWSRFIYTMQMSRYVESYILGTMFNSLGISKDMVYGVGNTNNQRIASLIRAPAFYVQAGLMLEQGTVASLTGFSPYVYNPGHQEVVAVDWAWVRSFQTMVPVSAYVLAVFRTKAFEHANPYIVLKNQGRKLKWSTLNYNYVVVDDETTIKTGSMVDGMYTFGAIVSQVRSVNGSVGFIPDYSEGDCRLAQCRDVTTNPLFEDIGSTRNLTVDIWIQTRIVGYNRNSLSCKTPAGATGPPQGIGVMQVGSGFRSKPQVVGTSASSSTTATNLESFDRDSYAASLF